MKKGVSVIIPTLACSSRRSQLQTAIKSVQQSVDVDLVRIIVCVNGSNWDKEAVENVRQMKGVEVHFIKEASLPKALAFGRSLVSTEYFCFLDDDDELLPGSINVRLNALDERDDIDFAVTNGYNYVNGEMRMRYPALPSGGADPFTSLFERNWLASCGALYRSASVGLSYFTDGYAYREWFWLAFNLLMDKKRVMFIDSPMYVVNILGESLSTSVPYGKADVMLHQKMLDRLPPKRILRLIKIRMSRTAHHLSDEALRRGRRQEALSMHLRSIALPGGLAHLSYTRHLL